MGKQTYVIGIDASTQSTKAVAWTREGCVAAQARARIETMQPQTGYAEQEAESWWSSTCTVLADIFTKISPDDVAALAISNQRETMVFVDKAGRPLAPATLWFDERVSNSFKDFAKSFGAEQLHHITGKQPDLTPALYRLHWFRRHAPDLLDQAAKILDVHGFLTMRFSGTPHATYTSADPFGIFDLHSKTWSKPILDHLGLSLSKFPSLSVPGQQACCVSQAAAAVTGLRAGTPIIAAGGDGQCAGLGANAVTPGKVYLNLGTALVVGVWSEKPFTSRHWRTMISASEDGFFLESLQRAGALMMNWLIDNFAGGRADPDIFMQLEAKAARLPIGAEGLLVSPYLTGCMDPHWDPHARANFIGFGTHHTMAHLYRATLEALTMESARAIAAMRSAGLATEQIIAIGGGAASQLWLEMFANATGLPVHRGESDEASALGAGMLAAFGVGWYKTINDAASSMARTVKTILPDPQQTAAWAAMSARQEAIYEATAKLHESLIV